MPSNSSSTQVVSIHASVKDATTEYPDGSGIVGVSIHASVKDATTMSLRQLIFILVSIHASVKDATVFSLILSTTPCGFNPRICKRCDHGL